METLSTMPERCALSLESDAFGEEIRQLYRSYRILFTIRGARVHILHVRHARQDRLAT